MKTTEINEVINQLRSGPYTVAAHPKLVYCESLENAEAKNMCEQVHTISAIISLNQHPDIWNGIWGCHCILVCLILKGNV